MAKPKKAVYEIRYTYIEVSCPWCSNDQSFKLVFVDELNEEVVYDCDQCHRPFTLDNGD